jgi:YgiT-type zinc finger domain-containing protein
MKCGICKAEMEQKMVTYTEDVCTQGSHSSVIVIRNVPATVCTECGNIWYTGTVAARLEEIVDHCIQGVVADVAVVQYAENAA